MFNQSVHRILGMLLFLFASSSVWADGAYFSNLKIGSVTDLAQTRQEAVMAIHDDQVTYVLRTQFSGGGDAFAWVVPVPAAPSDVVAHADNALFDALESQTAPIFDIRLGPVGGGCGCSSGGMSQLGSLVQVEASGQTGVFDWVSLTSSGGAALRTWLNDNGFTVPASADSVLDTYIQQDMHFLGVRLNEFSATGAGSEMEIPPFQFTISGTRRFYPMTISQISSAAQTEVILYVLADHRNDAANLSNALIEPSALQYDATSASLTNYEALFTQTLANAGGPVLVTEFASPVDASLTIYWREVPPTLGNQLLSQPTGLFLTRMRTVLTPAEMDRDFEFRDALDDTTVSNQFFIDAQEQTASASVLFGPLAVILAFVFLRAAVGRSTAATL